MKCLLCKYVSTQNDEELLNHYIYFHNINENNYYFKELLSLDSNSHYPKYCDKCKRAISTCRVKKNHSFLKHYQQIDGFLNNRPINISRRGPVTYFSINFSLHSNFYNLFDGEKTIDDFIEVVRQKFVPNDNAEVQGSIYLVNYQPAQSNVISELEDKRIWSTDVYCCDL